MGNCKHPADPAGFMHGGGRLETPRKRCQLGTVFSHSSLKLTCTNRCPSGSSATLPPAAAPHPLFLCRPGPCTLGKCKTSTKPARTRRPTPTASPGSIAPTSSSTFSLSAAQNNRRVESGAAKRVRVSFLPLETITHGINGEPQVSPLPWRAHPSGNPVLSMMERRAHTAVKPSNSSTEAVESADAGFSLALCTRGITVKTEHSGTAMEAFFSCPTFL